MTNLKTIEQATSGMTEWLGSNETVYLDVLSIIKHAVQNYNDKGLMADVVKDKVGEFCIDGVTPEGDSLEDVDWAELIACIILE